MKIIFGYSHLYSGHSKAAENVIEALKFYGVDDIEEVVISKILLGELAGVFSKMYMFLVKNIPEAWNIMWNNPAIGAVKNDIFNMQVYDPKAFSILLKNVKKIIEKTKPDAVVSTHALAKTIFSYIKKTWDMNFKLHAIVTDYIPHNYWVSKEVDRYFVATYTSKNILKNYGVQEEKIITSGIPVSPKFLKNIDKEEIRKKYGLQKSNTVLIAGGGHGIISKEVVELITKLPFNFIVICGRNKILFKQLSKTASSKIKLFGYINSMHEVMKVSQCIITKAGGLTLAEACVSGVPVIIYKPLPGQELENLRYFLKNRMAVYAENINELNEYLKKILYTELGNELVKNMKKYSMPYASFEIAGNILSA